MARGGARVGAGRPRVNAKNGPLATSKVKPMPDGFEPLAYMLAVMNDPKADAGRRDRMAVAAAPYCHTKVGDQGKKPTKNAAAKDAAAPGNRFATQAAPRLVSNR